MYTLFDQDRINELNKMEAVAEATKSYIIGMINEGLNVESIARVVNMSVKQVTAIGKQAALL